MSQLKVLIPNRAFETSSGQITLKPFKFMQFALALAIVENYISIFTKYDTSAEIAQALFAKEELHESYTVLADICKLLSLVSNATIETLNDLQYDEVLGLLVEVIDMNMDFWPDRETAKSSRTPQPPLLRGLRGSSVAEDWGVRVSRLIRFGHSWSEIQNYSYAQIKLFIEAAGLIEAEDRRNRLLEGAIASQGSQKVIKEAIRNLGG